MGGAPYKFAKEGVGALSSVSTFYHKAAPLTCFPKLDAFEANTYNVYD